MKNHKKTPQDCHLYSQTIFKKGLWPCVYCGVQLAHQNSQRLEKHIEHHHPQGNVLRLLHFCDLGNKITLHFL